jgi:membrane protein YqaA with SNARE-associated domain
MAVDLIGWVIGFFSAHPTGLVATLLFVLAVSIAGNIIPFFPTPYLLLVVTIAVGDAYQGIGIVQLAAVAALGAASGKLVSYALGYGARRAIRKQERFDSLRKLLGGSTFLVGVLFAASPLVDAAFIPMGIIRYSPPKTYLALYTGKFIWILSLLYLARQSSQFVNQFFGENVYASVVSAALVLSTAYLIIRVDWEKRLLGHKDSLRSRLLSRLRNVLSRQQRTEGQKPGQQDTPS